MLRAPGDENKHHHYSNARPLRLGLTASSEKFVFSSRGACSQLSKPAVSRLSKSVVSIASFIGQAKFVERTGLCIQTSCANATSFLTSASLFPRTAQGKIRDNVTIKVCLPSNQSAVTGRIEIVDVYFDFAVVNIEHVAGFHATHLDHDIPFEAAYRKVVAVWRRFNSELLIGTTGVELGSPAVEPSKIMLSTCKITKAGIGGPLVDSDGNFVGMNNNRSEYDMTPFIKRVLILKVLGNRGIVSMGIKQKIDVISEGSTSEMQKSFTQGCPRLINSIEDLFLGNIWSKLRKDVASRISRSVVSLASFDGDATFFACTGFVSHCHASSAYILTSASLVRVSGDGQEINTKLRIEVCLRNRFRVIGILKACNLMFNLACIEIMGHWDLLALELHPESMQKEGKKHQPESLKKRVKEVQPESFVGPHLDVIAVGCLFDGPSLMATGGLKLMNRQSKLDCSELYVSSCKITKAGVGGPLIDFDGNLLGMNFYHHEETPFLKTYYLCAFLRYVCGLGECFQQDKCSHDFSPLCNKAYRWPLPKTCPYQWPFRMRKPERIRYRTVEESMAKQGFVPSSK